MATHLGFTTADPWPVRRVEEPLKPSLKGGGSPKVILRADRNAGSIRIDSETTLEGIPPEAWQYKLGNRSALDWVLDQYKERKSRDPVIIKKKFNTYKFADHKEAVIDLLARVTRVSVATAAIQEEMASAGTGS
jgi:predicted helicase